MTLQELKGEKVSVIYVLRGFTMVALGTLVYVGPRTILVREAPGELTEIDRNNIQSCEAA